MPSVKSRVPSRRKSRTSEGGSGTSKGAWLTWPTALAVCHLDLRPPSLWQVFMAVLLTSLRYGGGDARLSVDDLSLMTGLSARTVKGAVAALIGRGLLTRVRRYGCLRVNFPAVSAGGADKLAPPVVDRESGRGADKPAPPRCKLVCTSPTSIYVSSLSKEESRPATFTDHQLSLIADVFAEVTELLGSDVARLSMPDAAAKSMGLAPPIGYGEAFEAVAHSGDRRKARDYSRAVLDLRRDERVQGRELM